jgi:hypothetical protein
VGAESGIQPGEPTEERSIARAVAEKPAALFLILLMAIGSVFLWLCIPLGWVWIASHAVKTTQPTLGPYLLILVGVPVSMFVVGKLLYRLNHVYERLTGRTSEVRMQLPWHRSLRGERTPNRRTTVLEFVMIWSVSLALVCFAVWFFFFAHARLPG